MKYEIIATLGPVSNCESIWRSFTDAGATGFRLNTSHLSLDELFDWLTRLNKYFIQEHFEIPVVLDLQGSKWRLGIFPEFELQEGNLCILRLAQETTISNELPVPHEDFFWAARITDSYILLNDAKIQLRMLRKANNHIQAIVVKGGLISTRKGITYQESKYRKETLSEKDMKILELTSKFHYIRYAISYIRDSEELKNYRYMLGPNCFLIAKIERLEAIESASQMEGLADQLWLCRGDLGAELGMNEMAKSTHSFSEKVRYINLPVLLAGQVLEHMTTQPNPTRSEISYLYDVLQKGFKGVVLSDETAIGKYPIEAVRTAAMFM